MLRPAGALVAMLMSVVTLACGPSTGDDAGVGDSEITRVAWLNEGWVGSEVWTDAHASAAEGVASEFGADVEIEFFEGVDPRADAPELIDDLVADGVDLVFATSFPFSETMLAAAGRHPDVSFAQARGTVTAPNLGTYAGADEEPIYLAGIAAGASTSTGVVGFVGTTPEPETIRHVNAFALGVRSVRPDATVLLSWVDAWWDPEGELVHAQRLLERGSDVLGTGFISVVTGELATASGIPWVGHHADRSRDFPEVWLTGAVPDWTTYYIDSVRSLRDGTWKPDSYYGSMADGYTDAAPLGARVPQDARDRISTTRDAFLSEAQGVFAGPVLDDQGRERISSGDALDEEGLMKMDWFVDGVVILGEEE